MLASGPALSRAEAARPAIVRGVKRTLLAVALALLAGAAIASRPLLVSRLERGMIKIHGPGSRTPATRGLAFEELRIPSGSRTLRAFYVPAESALAPALLIFHGNGEAISSWVEALKLLHDDGLTVMVFDYSGFGASTGEPTLAHFREDGFAAWRAFRARLPAATRACAYGLSLGSGVLLDVASELTPAPDCVATSGAFTSARDLAVLFHRVPRWLAKLLPDVLDNVEGAARLKAPLLVEHGDRDELFPVAYAERIAAAHPGAELAIVPGMKHGDPVAHPTEAAWRSVVAHVKGQGARAAGR